MKFVIFILPIIFIFLNLYRRFFNVQKNTEAHLLLIKEKGIKKAASSKIGLWVVLPCYIFSAWLIPLGWLWAALAIVLALSTLVFLLLPEQSIAIPEPNSPEFMAVVKKRKKQSLFGVLLIILWVASWSYA